MLQKLSIYIVLWIRELSVEIFIVWVAKNAPKIAKMQIQNLFI
jgi:hypothetical protein